MLLDSPDFPAEYRGSAEGALYAQRQLRASKDLSWSYLSPAAITQSLCSLKPKVHRTKTKGLVWPIKAEVGALTCSWLLSDLQSARRLSRYFL